MSKKKKQPTNSGSNSETKDKSGTNECVRCGTCCEKGGPSFHHDDRMLIEKGIILSKYLYTIRRGELAYDNVQGCLRAVESDIIKIKGKGDGWICLYFDEDKRACMIYDDRPLECRALRCWDTREIEQIYASNRLTREDLVSEIEGLWDLVKDHQTRCDYQKIQKLTDDLINTKSQSSYRKLLEIVRYDAEIRKLVISQGGLEEDMLDFLFGRPLTKTLRNYGFKVQQKGKKIGLVRMN